MRKTLQSLHQPSPIEFALILGLVTFMVSLVAIHLVLPAPPPSYLSSYSFGAGVFIAAGDWYGSHNLLVLNGGGSLEA